MKGKSIGFSVQYLKFANDITGAKLENINSAADLNNIDILRKILTANAIFAIQTAANKMLLHVSNGKAMKAAWDEHSGNSNLSFKINFIFLKVLIW